MSVPHCSAWLRSWGLLRLARISPSFKRQCSMAVQEAGREKETQKHDGKQQRETLAPNSWALEPPGPTKPHKEASPEGDMEAGGLGQHALFLEWGCIPTVKPLDTIPRGLTSRGRVQLTLETRYILTQSGAERGRGEGRSPVTGTRRQPHITSGVDHPCKWPSLLDSCTAFGVYPLPVRAFAPAALPSGMPLPLIFTSPTLTVLQVPVQAPAPLITYPTGPTH